MYLSYTGREGLFVLFQIQNSAIFLFCFSNETYFPTEHEKLVYFYIAFYMWKAEGTKLTVWLKIFLMSRYCGNTHLFWKQIFLLRRKLSWPSKGKTSRGPAVRSLMEHSNQNGVLRSLLHLFQKTKPKSCVLSFIAIYLLGENSISHLVLNVSQ